MHVRSFLPAAMGAAIAILAVAAPAARVGATDASTCTTQSGVTVIGDFSHFGRGIEQGCAPGSPTTALAAMHAAGFSTAGTAQYGDAFVCRIDNLPSPKSEACASTPPAKASWAFYFAHATDSDWTYSAAGVLSNDPPPGSIIAFAFGDYAKPGVRPAAAIVTPSTTTAPLAPTTAPPSVPVTVQAVIPPAVSVGGPPITAFLTGPAGPTTSTPGTPSTPDTGTSTSLPSGASATLKFVTGPAATAKPSSGSALPAVIAVVLVAMLSAGAVVAMRARRHRAA